MADLSLRPPKAPNLLIAPEEYQQRYADQLNNALRLYFNQIDNGLTSLFSDAGRVANGVPSSGGANLSFPHVAASDSTDQYATALNTPTVVKWNTLASQSGFTLNAPGSVTCNVSGIYKITFSAQLANTANASHDATFWLRENTVDIADSATIFTLPARKSAGVPSYVAGYSEVVFTANAGDVVELWWATDLAATSGGGLGVYIFHDAAWTTPTNPYPRPAVPSVIGSITFVSRLPTQP